MNPEFAAILMSTLGFIAGGLVIYLWNRRAQNAVVDEKVEGLDEQSKTVDGLKEKIIGFEYRLEHIERNPVEKVVSEIREFREDFLKTNAETQRLLTKHEGQFVTHNQCGERRRECNHGGKAA